MGPSVPPDESLPMAANKQPSILDWDDEVVDFREPATSSASTEQGKTADQQRDNSLSSMFGDITLFREFFLAAFSDGYNSVRLTAEVCFLIETASAHLIFVHSRIWP